MARLRAQFLFEAFFLVIQVTLETEAKEHVIVT